MALAAALTAAATAGCASRQGRASLELKELTQTELDAFLDKGVDPRTRSIRVRRGAAGAEFEGGTRPWLGKMSRTRLKKVKDGFFPVTEAETIAKTKFNALVDTSARQSWLLLDSARALDFRAFKEPGGRPVGEYADHVRMAIPGYAGVGGLKVLLGKPLHVEDPVFYVAPGHGMLGALAREENGSAGPSGPDAAKWRRRTHAVFGAAFVKAFATVQLDFRRGEVLWLTSKEWSRGAKNGGVGARLGDWRGRPAIAIRLGGKDVTAVVDTAGDFAVSVPGAWLREGAGPDNVQMDLEIGGRLVAADAAVRTHESLGLPGDWPVARVGWRVWKEYAVTFDWKHDTLWLDKPEWLPGKAQAGGKDPDAPAAPIHYRGIDP